GHPHQGAEQFGVPRRFGIGTILIVLAAASLLLAVLMAMGAHPLVVLCLIGFLVILAAGQALLFGGKDPRRASAVTGAAVGFIVPGIVMLVGVIQTGIRSFLYSYGIGIGFLF